MLLKRFSRKLLATLKLLANMLSPLLVKITYRKPPLLRRGRRVFVFSVILIGFVSFTFFIQKVNNANLLQEETTLTGDIMPYVLAERHSTNLPSRKWMAHTIEIVKNEGFSPPAAARYFAYVASVYADSIEKTGSTEQASLASAELLISFFSEHKNDTNDVLVSLGFPGRELLPEAKLIVEYYIERSRDDNFHLVWDQKITGESAWYIRNDKIDDGAMAKEWEPWIIDRNAISIPRPPSRKSYRDKLELEKVMYATEQRSPDDEEIIFFWEGMDTFYRNSRRNYNALAGIWQNILFVEVGDFTGDVYSKHRNQKSTTQGIDDVTYARYQKALAQGIADAMIVTWKAKYVFFAQRPSMRIPRLNAILQDPPYPAYVSEHAVASAAAATILTAAFPEKESVWFMHAKNSRNSRFLAGAQFDIDNKGGVPAGEAIGRMIAEKFFENAKIPQVALEKNINSNVVTAIKDLVIIAMQRIIADIRQSISALAFFENIFPGPMFVNVAEESGVAMRLITGVSWGDYDSDGNLDLLTQSGLYRNQGDGTFAKTNFDAEFLRAPGVFGDYDNDGCLDVYIVRSGEMPSLDTKGLPDVLFKNNCDGTFTDVTEQAGIHGLYHGMSASWADYNNDGYLDIYVLNRGILLGDALAILTIPYKFEPNILYRNNGDGTFTDVTDEAGADGILDCDEYKADPNGLVRKMKLPFQSVWFDYNNDNRIDLFLVSDSFTSPLYRNNGDGTFTQVTREAGLCLYEREANMGVTVGDFNEDGFLDIYVTDAGDNFLWHNNGDGTFINVAKESGANDLGYGWGTEFFDYDNDSNLDILVVNGNNRLRAKYYYVPELKGNDLDELFRNNGDGTFSPVGESEGFVHGNKIKYSAAVADYNNDGFPDIFIAVSGERHSAATSLLYKNLGNTNHWVTFQLIGTQSNRDGIGARITVSSGGKTQVREVIAGSSYLAQSSPWPTFGLGKSEHIDNLTVRWPSGIVQTFDDVPIDQKVIIKEDSQKIYKKSGVFFQENGI